ncbi:uncharacterized protein LOC111674065 isoform X1 [Orussus abietinus]|uniref:uncharacterized protein LOC111674065 isoform X1 n=1 Tax=Orussus abietinus TaxID=222816 RepID=UPI000C715B69|nr:uncharacterized protein LOC111674065 isoform X1 [Orussus abietinus]
MGTYHVQFSQSVLNFPHQAISGIFHIRQQTGYIPGNTSNRYETIKRKMKPLILSRSIFYRSERARGCSPLPVTLNFPNQAMNPKRGIFRKTIQQIRASTWV